MKERLSPSQDMNNVLSKLGVIVQQRNGLVSRVEDCEWIPYYMFRFEDNTEKSIYDDIKHCIETFDGKLKWTLYYEPNQPPKRLYVIIPQKYANKAARGRRKNARGMYVKAPIFEDELYGEEAFWQTCNFAILDTPKLIDWISNWFDI